MQNSDRKRHLKRSIYFLFFLAIFNTIPVYGYEVVLVTGASRGIGASIANNLAQWPERYKVYAGVRATSNSAQLITSDNLQAIVLDVTDDRSVAKAVKYILEQEGHLDVLVNNAGIMMYGSHENLTIKEAKKIFDVNYFGMLRVTQEVLEPMREQKKGRIIQIGSRSGFRPLPSLSVYGDSKAALLSASQIMAVTLTPWDIKISVVEPGPVLTELDANSPYGSRLKQAHDPFHAIFKRVDLLAPEPGAALGSGAQQAEEIAMVVQHVIETPEPHLRYQTTDKIQGQAAQRAVDPSGNKDVEELRSILFE